MSADGILEEYVGCMFSGKTEEMMRNVRRAEVKGRNVLVLTPNVDWRGSEDALYSHAGRQMGAKPVDFHSEEILKTVKQLSRKMRIYGVAIDEAQFFDENLPDVVKELKRKFEEVMVAHLNYTFDGRPFPFRSNRRFEDDSDRTVGDLMEIAEKVYTLAAICTHENEDGTRCNSEEAFYSQRLVHGEPTTTGPTILIGEQEYEARCRDDIVYSEGVNIGKFANYLD